MGRSPALFVGGLLVLAVAACGGSVSSPTPHVSTTEDSASASASEETEIGGQLTAPPLVARLAVTINSFGDKQAIMGLTPVRFDLTGSDGFEPRYRIEYGDGGMSEAPLSTHVYQSEGTFTVRATVWDRRGRSDTTHAVVRVLSLVAHTIDVWHGNEPAGPTRHVRVYTHEGRNLTDSITRIGDRRWRTFGSQASCPTSAP